MTYINESCKYCGKELTNSNDIFVDIDSDNYCCSDCAKVFIRTYEYYSEEDYDVVENEIHNENNECGFNDLGYNNVDLILENKRKNCYR